MNNSKKDINLSEAVKRHEQKLPPMPADLNDRVMKSLTSLPSRPLQGERELKRGIFPLRWFTTGIAAGIILLIGIFLLMKDGEPEVEEPVVAEVVEQPAPEVPKAPDYSEYSESSDKSEPIQLTKPTTHRSEPVLAEAEQQPAESDVVRLTNTADSLAYYLTRLENQMGDCRDSICLAKLSELMRADDRIKTLVNKIIHKQVETVYQEEYLVDTTTHYILL